MAGPFLSSPGAYHVGRKRETASTRREPGLEGESLKPLYADADGIAEPIGTP